MRRIATVCTIYTCSIGPSGVLLARGRVQRERAFEARPACDRPRRHFRLLARLRHHRWALDPRVSPRSRFVWHNSLGDGTERQACEPIRMVPQRYFLSRQFLEAQEP